MLVLSLIFLTLLWCSALSRFYFPTLLYFGTWKCLSFFRGAFQTDIIDDSRIFTAELRNFLRLILVSSFWSVDSWKFLQAWMWVCSRKISLRFRLNIRIKVGDVKKWFNVLQACAIKSMTELQQLSRVQGIVKAKTEKICSRKFWWEKLEKLWSKNRFLYFPARVCCRMMLTLIEFLRFRKFPSRAWADSKLNVQWNFRTFSWKFNLRKAFYWKLKIISASIIQFNLRI